MSESKGLRDAVEALAAEYAANGAAREAAGKPAWPNNVARDLRALLAQHPAKVCTCGAQNYPSCLCHLTPHEWITAHPERPAS